MKLENQVCSLPLAQRLKELGVKQGTSHFYWIGGDDMETALVTHDEFVPYWEQDDDFNPTAATPRHIALSTQTAADRKENNICDDVFSYAAFTVAELGDRIPDAYLHSIVATDRIIDGEHYRDWRFLDIEKLRGLRFDTEADARAKMLIYLLENKLIEL